VLFLCLRSRRQLSHVVFSFTKKFCRYDQLASRSVAIKPQATGTAQLDDGIDAWLTRVGPLVVQE
jgi:hypothetical protein